MKFFYIVGLICFCSHVLHAQQTMPYQLDAKKEAWVMGVAVPLSGFSLLMDKKLKPLTLEEISLLDAQDINRIDRFATNNFSEKVIHRSDLTMLSTIGGGFVSNFIAPALYPSSDSYGKQVATLGVIWFEANLVNFAFTELIKTTCKRSRPFLYGSLAPDELRCTKDARKSFFSGHASFTATNSFYAASVFTSYQKGNQWNPVIWGVSSLPPLLVAIQRVRAGKHFPTDVALGYVVGAACGILIPKLHEISPSVQGGIKSNGSFSPNGMTVQLVNFKMTL